MTVATTALTSTAGKLSVMCHVRWLTILLFLAAFCRPASAFYRDGWCSGTRVNAASEATTVPTGTINNGDLIILVAAAYNARGSQNAITYSAGTGTWTASLASTPWHGGDAQLMVLTHIYQSGDTFPTLADSGQTTYFSYIACAYYGTAGVDQIGAATTSSSTTINFPSEIPSQSDEEALFVSAIGGGGNPTFSNPSLLTTCSTTTDQVSSNKVINNIPQMSFYQVNLGPCAPGATGAQTLTSSGSGDSIGVTILLTSVQGRLREALGPNVLRNNIGPAYYQPGNGPASLDLAALGLRWMDILALYSSWNQIEPNNCDEYSWDYVDNMILNARALGLKVSLTVATGNRTPCGGPNEASCTGFSDGSSTPAWAYIATACDSNHAMVSGTDYINSMWVKPAWGPPTGNVNLIFDPNNPYYQHEWDRAIKAIGSRYSSIKNITSVKVTGLSKEGNELVLNNGANGSSVACDGTASQCTAICGSSACSRTLNDAAQWLAVGPGYTTSTFVPNDMEAAQKHFESRWHSAFPHAALMALTVALPAPPGTFDGTYDTFDSDMFTYDLSTYPHVIEEMNAALGWSQYSRIYIPQYLPVSNQPQLGVGLQTLWPENNVSGANCASNGLYSTSNPQCVTPSVYAALAMMMYPYIEFYISDWDTTAVQPWIKLVHDVAYGQ